MILEAMMQDGQSAAKNTKIMNMVVLGAFIGRTRVVKIESIMAALRKVLPERYHHLLPVNEQALRRGMELAGAMATA